MVDGGPRLAALLALRERHAVSLHGVGLSIVSPDPPSPDYLRRLEALAERVSPAMMSDHLAWQKWAGRHHSDFLPFPRTREALGYAADNLSQVQDVLGCRVLIENPSLYVDVAGHEMSETDFLIELSDLSGCGLLVDVNNVFVSASNLGFSADAYIDALPAAPIGEIHLAGHSPDGDPDGSLVIDGHRGARGRPGMAALSASDRPNRRSLDPDRARRQYSCLRRFDGRARSRTCVDSGRRGRPCLSCSRSSGGLPRRWKTPGSFPPRTPRCGARSGFTATQRCKRRRTRSRTTILWFGRSSEKKPLPLARPVTLRRTRHAIRACASMAEQFDAFLSGYVPFRELPWLAGWRASNGGASRRCSRPMPFLLSSASHQISVDTRLSLHPAARMVACNAPVASLWLAHQPWAAQVRSNA